ncbi:somatostatin-1A-like [Scyliorhinus canicula]|uniref:somatostatin-1A-like n=1 Tax=Scyliorhinus canicula TaxID=7830 RepID=UPI0018F330DD|nr:somatostatin-1A-like [Scyliorhinus canicula]
MWCSRLQLSLALLSIALAVLSVSSAPTDNRYREILQRAMAATGSGGKAELTKYSLAQLLSELENAENEALETDAMGGRNEVRLEPERSINPNLANRERKAGCKNFFWKTFTSC